MKVAYVGGTFDLFHIGHLNLLKRVKKSGYKVVVSLNEDSFVQRYKGTAPIIGFNERAEILKACEYVDAVINNEGDEDSKVSILKVKPDVIVHGSDWTGDSLMKQMSLTTKFMTDNKIKFLYLPYTQTNSSTKIKQRLKDEFIKSDRRRRK